MYRWHWYRKHILEHALGDQEEGPRRRPAAREPDRRAKQAEILALGRLRRQDPAEYRRAG